jgi:hypothetical protein
MRCFRPPARFFRRLGSFSVWICGISGREYDVSARKCAFPGSNATFPLANKDLAISN